MCRSQQCDLGGLLDLIICQRLGHWKLPFPLQEGATIFSDQGYECGQCNGPDCTRFPPSFRPACPR